jgi:hypothetical protein
MTPVHSTDRRCAASAFNETCPLRGQAATSPFRRRRACPFHWQAVRPCCRVHYAHHYSRVTKEAAADISTPGDCSGVLALVTSIMCSLRFVPRPTCRGSASLYVPPLSYKREDTRRDKTRSLRFTQTLIHSSSQIQYNTQWSRVLRSGSPNHSKSSCSLVFIDHLADRQNA